MLIDNGIIQMIEWESLDRDEQIKLREEFGHHLDTLPPTCSLDMKIARFKDWLREKGISIVLEEG
ncbi:MAG: hypothetical protein B6D71_00890 [gamma proteobacterium symbiont of Stewartia floridana]|nr:MAG: hypothetical protein B6D71_00890 [gamma proteobacterium symbiont of Stewartia floridana]